MHMCRKISDHSSRVSAFISREFTAAAVFIHTREAKEAGTLQERKGNARMHAHTHAHTASACLCVYGEGVGVHKCRQQMAMMMKERQKVDCTHRRRKTAKEFRRRDSNPGLAGESRVY